MIEENKIILDEEMFDNRLAPVEDKDRGVVPPVYAHAIRQFKVTDKLRDKARQVLPTPETKTPKVVSTEPMRKMHLSESLFDVVDGLEEVDILDLPIDYSNLETDNKPVFHKIKLPILSSDLNTQGMIELCRRALDKAGYTAEAEEMFKQANKAKGYDNVLRIIFEYAIPE